LASPDFSRTYDMNLGEYVVPFFLLWPFDDKMLLMTEDISCGLIRLSHPGFCDGYYDAQREVLLQGVGLGPTFTCKRIWWRHFPKTSPVKDSVPTVCTLEGDC